MREIKFRAWDGEDMLTNLDSVNLEAVRCDAIESPDGESVICCTYMQYTGLKDDSGAEWYEGDIVKCIDPEDDSTAEIVFKDAAFRKKYTEWDETLPYPIIDDLDLKWFRVIGNIHSNPDLVKP